MPTSLIQQRMSVIKRSFKVIIIGDQAVGKTSIIARFAGSQREDEEKGYSQGSTSSGRGSKSNSEGEMIEPRTTIGASFCQVIMKTSISGQITLNVWDTAGQERFRSMVGMYYRNADAALAIYDVTNHHSFLSLKKWIRELRENTRHDVVIIVVGNKIDMRSERTVDPKEAASFASAIGAAYAETTIKNHRKIRLLFADLAEQLVKLPDARNEAFTSSFQVKPHSSTSLKTRTKGKKKQHEMDEKDGCCKYF